MVHHTLSPRRISSLLAAAVLLSISLLSGSAQAADQKLVAFAPIVITVKAPPPPEPHKAFEDLQVFRVWAATVPPRKERPERTWSEIEATLQPAMALTPAPVEAPKHL
jgi:hypothetical protein